MRLYLLFVLFISSCALSPSGGSVQHFTGDVLLTENRVWQGDVLIDGKVTVAHGAVLRIAPGTQVRFVHKDEDRDGLGDATIIVKGSLIASGTQDQPIRFFSAEEKPAPGDWLEIRSDFARELLFDWCEFRDSAYTLHAHFTRGHMRNSHIHHNIDGSRLGRSRFLVQYNLIENNIGKGINFRDSEVRLLDNIIRNNGAGVFLFEKPGKSVIQGNNFYRNKLNLQLGDFFTDDVSLSGNWWGTADSAFRAQTIYDMEDDPELGRVYVEPVSSWLYSAGPQKKVTLTEIWAHDADGFIDSSPQAVGENVLYASWDGRVRLIDHDGELLWQSSSGDVVDSDIAVTAGKAYVQNWSRELQVIDTASGDLTESFQYPESPADDHRQGGITFAANQLLLPGWNGILYAINPENGKQSWRFDAGMPLRATPLVVEDAIYVAAGNGNLSALDFSGRLLWQHVLPAPLLTQPASVTDGLVVLDKAGTVYRYSVQGQLVWSLPLQQTCFYAKPLIDGDVVYIATAAGGLWKISLADGKPVWTSDLKAPIYASPRVKEGVVVVGDNEGVLHIVDKDRGVVLAQMSVEGAIQSQALMTGNRLYFGARDQKLHALDMQWGGPGE